MAVHFIFQTLNKFILQYGPCQIKRLVKQFSTVPAFPPELVHWYQRHYTELVHWYQHRIHRAGTLVPVSQTRTQSTNKHRSEANTQPNNTSKATGQGKQNRNQAKGTAKAQVRGKAHSQQNTQAHMHICTYTRQNSTPETKKGSRSEAITQPAKHNKARRKQDRTNPSQYLCRENQQPEQRQFI